MRIAINGTGIAGPTVAHWLRRFGHKPVLFEKAPALRAGGYVIDFWGLGYEIAERMGILPALMERGYLMERLRMVDGDGREVAGMDVAPLRQQVHGRFISIARADPAAALFHACDGIPVHFGVSIVDLRQDGHGLVVTFSDGRTECSISSSALTDSTRRYASWFSDLTIGSRGRSVVMLQPFA